MTPKQISDDALDALLSAPKEPIVDDGFTEQLLTNLKRRALIQAAIPLSMGLVGAVITAVMLPSGWLDNVFSDLSIFEASQTLALDIGKYGLIAGLFVAGGLLAVMYAAMSNQNK